MLRCVTLVSPPRPRWEQDSIGKAEAGRLLVACRSRDGSAVRSSWERHVPGQAGRVENDGKVLSDRQLSHLLDL